MSTTFSRLLVVMAASVLLGACASTPEAVVDHDPGFNFSKVNRITIVPLNRNVTPQTAISDMEAGRINTSLSSALADRGIQTTTDFEAADIDPNFFWKRSTRPSLSTNFCLPVKKGWQDEQISTLISGLAARVSKVFPHAQCTRHST